jgi:penicillin-binding protein 1A
VPISRATLSSDNTVYAQLTLDLGPENVAAVARKMGVTVPREEIVPAMGLGSISVSPLDMASAYATLAAGGIYSKPMAIRKVVFSDGKKDTNTEWGKPKRKRVLADWVAYEVTKILEDNVTSGTGVGAQIGRPAAGKTGTTDNHADAWFAGFVPQLETVVWVGYPQAQIPMENVHGISVAGGTFPADIWRRFMLVAMENRAVFEWKLPNHSPEWHPFEQGQYAVEYVEQQWSPSPGTTTTAVKPPPAAPPPAPVEPPPATTEPPPPTEPAPPPPTVPGPVP